MCLNIQNRSIIYFNSLLYFCRLDDLLFVSVTNDINSYLDTSFESYNNCIRQAYVRELHLELHFDAQYKDMDIQIYSCEYDMVRIASGMAGYLFANIQTTFYDSPSNKKLSNYLVWSNLNKLIDLDKNDECPIIYIQFEPNCTYCICQTCKYNFDYESLKKIFNLNNTNKTCPMCRSLWTNYIIYNNCIA